MEAVFWTAETVGTGCDNSYLATDVVNEDPMRTLPGHVTTYRIAVRPHTWRKEITRQTLPACDESFGDQVGDVAGDSLPQGTLSPRPGHT